MRESESSKWEKEEKPSEGKEERKGSEDGKESPPETRTTGTNFMQRIVKIENSEI